MEPVPYMHIYTPPPLTHKHTHPTPRNVCMLGEVTTDMFSMSSVCLPLPLRHTLMNNGKSQQTGDVEKLFFRFALDFSAQIKKINPNTLSTEKE